MAATPAPQTSRRNFLGMLAMAPLAGAALSACAAGGGSGSGGGGGGGGDTLKFWDMPWGSTQYNVVAKKVVEDYEPEGDLPAASYQLIQWNNFTQTFASAVASNTGPAVSSGGGFQAFQFADQGAIHYADKVVAQLDTNDFLPGLLDPFKTDEGYVAIPWQQDARVFWYRKSLLDAAGVTTPPTTWDEFHSACAALKKTGVFGYSAGTGAGNNLGVQQILAMMINNGGGVWNEGAELDCTFDRNVEAVDFIMSLAKEGFIDPSAVSYTTDNQNSQWKAKKFAMGIETGGLADNIGDTSGDVQVMSPMSALHGDKGALVYINNLMMYTEAPNKEGAEAFLTYYVKNLPTYWKQNLGAGLPAFKSIVDLPEFQANKNSLKIVNEYQPVFKTLAARGDTLSIKEAQIDSTAPMFTFAQTVYSGKGTAKDALAQLQQGLSALVK